MLKKDSDQLFNYFVYGFLTLIMIVMLYPMYFTIIASFSEPYDVVQGNVTFWFKGFSVDSYIQVFKNKDIWMGYRNTLIYTVLGVTLSMLMTVPAAYALSKPKLKFRGFFTTYFVITMYFSGGLLPTYLVVKDMHLLNKPYTLIILGAFSVYNLLITKTYFQNSIPDSLFEAAEIDGCSQFKQFTHVALPLAKPIIAVITLYYAVARWNEYFNNLIYVSKSEYYSLQMILRNILLESQNALSSIDATSMDAEEMAYMVKRAYMAESMKYSVIFIASLPMLIIYPFIQKHFVKGVMVGSVKG